MLDHAMRVVFVQPPVRVPVEHIDLPYLVDVGLLQCAAVAAAAGQQVAVVDAFAMAGSGVVSAGDWLDFGAPEAELVAAAVRAAPDVLVVAHSPYAVASAGRRHLARAVRALRAACPRAVLVAADCYVGGMHYRHHDGAATRRALGVDYLVRYESERPLARLLEAIAAGASVAEVLDGTEEVELDELPLPAWSRIDLGHHAEFLARVASSQRRPSLPLDGRTLPVLLSRGCPYRCTFCTSNPSLTEGAPKRQRRAGSTTIARVVSELRALGATRLVLLDELPNLDVAEFEQLVGQLEAAGLAFEIPNGLRADRLAPGMVRRLGRSMTSLAVSAESGSQRVVDEVVGKRLELAAVRRVAAEASDAAVPLRVHLLLGIPGETRAELLETLRFADELAALGAHPALQFPIPFEGTALERQSRSAASRAVGSAASSAVGSAASSAVGSAASSAVGSAASQAVGSAASPAAQGGEDGGPADGGDRASLLRRRPVVETEAATADELVAARDQLERRIASGRTRRLIVNLSYRCNNHCQFCAVGDRPHADASLADVRAALERYAAEGVTALDLDGGEPTLYPRLLSVLRSARQQGFRTLAVSTNGRRLSYPRFASAILDTGLVDVVRLSLHGSRAAVHDALTGVPGSFVQTLAGLRAALARPAIQTAINTTFVRENLADLDALAGLLQQLGARRWTLQAVTPFGRARASMEPDARAVSRTLSALLDRWGTALDIDVVNLPLCRLPGHEARLAADLGKNERDMLFVGGAGTNLTRFLDGARQRVEACAECLLQVVCGGPYRFSESEPLLDRGLPESGPLLDLIVGYRCNSGCVFCAIEDELRGAELPLAVARRELELGRAYAERVRFGGGEPTLRRELPALVALAKRLGYREIAVQTNGYLLSYPKVAQQLARAGLDRCHVSVRGASASTHDALTRVPGSFDLMGRSIENLIGQGVEVIADVIVVRQTLPELVPIVRALRPMGVEGFHFWYVAPQGRASRDSSLIPSMKDAAAAVSRAIEQAVALGARSTLAYYLPRCLLPGLEHHVWEPAAERAVVVTPHDRFVLEQGAVDLGVKVDACRDCAQAGRCIGIRPAYLERFGSAEITGPQRPR